MRLSDGRRYRGWTRWRGNEVVGKAAILDGDGDGLAAHLAAHNRRTWLMPFPIRKMASDSFRAADPVGVSFPRFPGMRLGLTPGFHGGRFIYPRHNPGHGMPEKMGAQSTAARLPHL